MDEISPLDTQYFCTACRVTHPPGNHLTLDEVGQAHIKRVYDALGQRKLETARKLGIRLNTLKARLARFD